jgi:dipeptidyl aminopeptidase/acylaminoacyl peptidase
MLTQEYASGRAVDLLGDMSAPTVLLWHGMQTDSRTAVRPLAEMLSDHGVAVVVPDWDSHADDGGRTDLLNSVDFATKLPGAAGGLTLVGWSMGGVAAAGLTLHADRFEVPLVHTVCLGGAFMARDPISGGHVGDGLTSGRVGAPVTLLHGVNDDVVPVTASREFAAGLERVGWPVSLVELDTDHGAIAGARYDASVDRYFAAGDEQTRRTAADVAARIAATMGFR